MADLVDRSLENIKGRIEKTLNDKRLLEVNRATLRDFLTSNHPKAVHTQEFYVNKLRELSVSTKKPFKQLKKADLKAFLDEKSNRKPRTTNGYIATFKAFYRWLYQMPAHQFPECVAWLEKTKPEPAIRSRHELITKEEFKQLLNSTTDPRIKCYLVMSLEGLYRRSEIRLMRLKDLVVQDTHAMAYSYERKTHSPNYKPLVFSKPYIVAWLNVHPFRDDPESPLFVPMRPKPEKKFVADNVFNAWLRSLVKATGIKKRLTPHQLRHLRTTLMLLSGWSKDHVRSLGGWTTNQMMDKTYSHIEKEDVANAILSTYGIKTNAVDGDIQVTKCMTCGHPVSELEEYCPNCRNAPSIEKAEQEQKKLLSHKSEEIEDVKELKKRIENLETYVKQKLIDEMIRAVLKK